MCFAFVYHSALELVLHDDKWHGGRAPRSRYARAGARAVAHDVPVARARLRAWPAARRATHTTPPPLLLPTTPTTTAPPQTTTTTHTRVQPGFDSRTGPSPLMRRLEGRRRLQRRRRRLVGRTATAVVTTHTASPVQRATTRVPCASSSPTIEHHTISHTHMCIWNPT